MNKTYGYCRISRKTQNIERQERNIRTLYPDADIRKEAYTGTKLQGRKALDGILKDIKSGDTLVFDSVSRMSRNADEGTELYFRLYNQGVNLVFLKEHHIDTESYTKALQAAGINIVSDGTATGELVSDIAKAIEKFMRAKAADDIRKGFDQAQKEVDDLHQRTAEGIETARRAGKQIGQKPGAKLTTKKSIEMKEKIRKYSADFDGSLNDIDCVQLLGIARNTYYKYKREMREEMV